MNETFDFHKWKLIQSGRNYVDFKSLYPCSGSSSSEWDFKFSLGVSLLLFRDGFPSDSFLWIAILKKRKGTLWIDVWKKKQKKNNPHNEKQHMNVFANLRTDHTKKTQACPWCCLVWSVLKLAKTFIARQVPKGSGEHGTWRKLVRNHLWWPNDPRG